MKPFITFVALAALGVLWVMPASAYADNKDIGALQRDIYDVNRKLDTIQTAQAQKLEELQTLLKQAMDANAKLSADMKALQDGMTRNQAEQQTRLFEPMAGVKSGVSDLSDGMAALQTNITDLRTRQTKLESTIASIDGTVKLLYQQSQTPVAPAAPPVAAAPTSEQSATLLFAAAQRSKLTGDLQGSLKQFGDVFTMFPSAPEAPMAVYEIGRLYADNDQPEEAVQAFDRVLEQFPENPMWKEAQFGKAEQLAALGNRTEAAREYDRFAQTYPSDRRADDARARAKELRAPAAKGRTPASNTKKAKAKQP